MSLKRILDSYLDPVLDRDPYTLNELKEDYKNKEIGKDWYDEEVEKLKAIWNAIPEKRQKQLQSGGKTTLNIAGETWSRAREFKPWYQPGENIGALGIRGIEGLGWLSNKLIGQPVSHAAHNWLGIHKPVAGGIGLGTEIVLDPLAVGKLSKISNSRKAQKFVHRLGQEARYHVDSAAFNVNKNINRIQKDVGWAKDQFQYTTGQKLRPLTKKPSVYTDIEEIFEGSHSYLRKANKIYQNHEGGISWKKAMEIAKKNDLQMNIGYGNEIMNTGDNFNYLPNPSPDELLDIHKDLPNTKSIKQITLEDRLNDPRIEKFLTGKGKLQSKELSNLVQDFSDREDFMGVVSSRIDQLKEKYPNLVRKLDDQKETIALRWHHVNPSKGPIDLYKGLTNPADRAVLKDTLVKEFDVFSGNHPLNNRGLSIDVHDQIHDWLGQTVGLRADVLKYKWAQTAGIDVGDLAPGKGFMSNHQVLSPQGRDAFDAWFSKLKPDERLPFIREYGSIIKESETMLSDLMKQYDALFAVPEGYSISPDNEVLLRLFESIPTDGSKLIQKDIKRIIDQVNLEMPRGTLDIINEEGVVKQLNLESDIYKRIVEVKAELDGIKDLRKARSHKAELKKLEEGILQQTLDFSGAQKQGAWKKRLEQEKLRREGKINKILRD